MTTRQPINLAAEACKRIRCSLPLAYLATYARLRGIRIHIGRRKIIRYRIEPKP